MNRRSCIALLALAHVAVSAVAFERRYPRVNVTRQNAPRVICVDPGHPSEINSGYTVQNGTTETRMNWVIALQLKRLLTQAGYRVVMTKQSERELVTNRRRAEIANASGAAIMVRLHCDTGSGRGFRVYYPDRAGLHGKTVGPSAAVCAASRRAALAMRAGLAAKLRGSLVDNGIATDRQTAVGKKQGALTGSIYSKVPAVTIEMCFLSHSGDAKFIKSAAGQRMLAAGLAEGIRRYVPPR